MLRAIILFPIRISFGFKNYCDNQVSVINCCIIRSLTYRILFILTMAGFLVACESTKPLMSIEKARTVTAEFQGRDITPPPRSITDVRKLLGSSELSSTACDQKHHFYREQLEFAMQSATGRVIRGGMTHTKQPSEFPGRFNCLFV